MISKKVYIVLFIILFVFFIVMFALFGVDNIKQEQYSSVVIVGDSSVWKYEDKRWLNIRTRGSLENLSWQKYHIFLDNKEIGEYNLWYNTDRWYAFDDKKNAIQVDNTLIAYQANYDMKIKGFEIENIENDEYVNQVFKKHNIGLTSIPTSLYKTKFDFDNDNVEEEFYIMSNAFSTETEPEKTYSIAFYVKNETINYLYEYVETNTKAYEGCKPYYNAFLDVNNDNIYEFILSCGKYSANKQIDMLYQYIDDGFKIVISNQ